VATLPEVAIKSIAVRVCFCERRRTKAYTNALPTIRPPITPTTIPAIAPEDILEMEAFVATLEIEDAAEDTAEDSSEDTAEYAAADVEVNV
jgi:hypothetical protein